MAVHKPVKYKPHFPVVIGNVGVKIAPNQTPASVLGLGGGNIPAGMNLPKDLNAQVWINLGAWVEVISSNVEAIMYDKDKQSLFVRFQGTKGMPSSEYEYFGVSESLAKDMYNCAS